MINKFFFITFFSMLVFVIPTAYSQDEDVGNTIVRHISNGNSQELSKFFNASIQLTLPDNDGRFSKPQAELIMRNFFIKYPPKSFTISHKGSSSDGSRYFIGVYKSSNNTFRSYYLLKLVTDAELIHQLRLENDD
ncbi:MAG: DUF4783 domain-containing protein [Bacteroidales bacterium]|nr:DUF4783 domain-containing protein [Bacteroidales bacterium]